MNTGFQAKKDIRVYNPPKKWKTFALKQGIQKLYFITSPSLNFSFRQNNNIYFNLKTYNWKIYSQLIQVLSFEETVTCKFLHEIGHFVNNHKDIIPGLKIKITELDLEYALEKICLEDILSLKEEKEAWDYVKIFRSICRNEYMQLIETFKEWFATHIV